MIKKRATVEHEITPFQNIAVAGERRKMGNSDCNYENAVSISVDEAEKLLRTGIWKNVLKRLSLQLSEEFCKGFDERNLRNMRLFCSTFPNWNAVRSELTWTHYRSLLKVNDKDD